MFIRIGDRLINTQLITDAQWHETGTKAKGEAAMALTIYLCTNAKDDGRSITLQGREGQALWEYLCHKAPDLTNALPIE